MWYALRCCMLLVLGNYKINFKPTLRIMQHYQFFETLTFNKTEDYTNHVPEISTLLIPNHSDHAHLKTLLYNLDPSKTKAPLDAFNTRLRLPRPDSAQVLDIIKFIEKQEDDFRKPVAPLHQN